MDLLCRWWYIWSKWHFTLLFVYFRIGKCYRTLKVKSLCQRTPKKSNLLVDTLVCDNFAEIHGVHYNIHFQLGRRETAVEWRFYPCPFLFPPSLSIISLSSPFFCRTKAVMAWGLCRRVAQLCAGLEHVAWLWPRESKAWGNTRTTTEVCSALARKQCSAADEGEATSGSERVCMDWGCVVCTESTSGGHCCPNLAQWRRWAWEAPCWFGCHPAYGCHLLSPNSCLVEPHVLAHLLCASAGRTTDNTPFAAVPQPCCAAFAHGRLVATTGQIAATHRCARGWSSPSGRTSPPAPQPMASAHTARGEKWEERERIEREGGRRKGQG